MDPGRGELSELVDLIVGNRRERESICSEAERRQGPRVEDCFLRRQHDRRDTPLFTNMVGFVLLIPGISNFKGGRVQTEADFVADRSEQFLRDWKLSRRDLLQLGAALPVAAGIARYASTASVARAAITDTSSPI